MRADQQRESGTTLIELLVAVSILLIVTGALATSIVVGLRTFDATANRERSSHDAQLVSVYLPSDLQNTPNDVVAAPTNNTDCSGAPNLLRIQWAATEAAGGPAATYVAAYVVASEAGEWRLTRNYCVNGASPSRIVVAHNLDGLNAGIVDLSQPPQVTLTLIEAKAATDTSNYRYTISGTRRTTSQASQAIVFTSAAPTNATVSGATYTATATATSALAVAFTSATPLVCTMAGSAVSFVSAGSCNLNANQAGSASFLVAPQAQQAFAVVLLDTTAPVVTVTSPANNGAVKITTPTISGTAGQVAAGASSSADLPTVTVKIYAGATTGGALLQTLTATQAGGAWSVVAAALTTGAQYTVQARQADGSGNTGTSPANTFVVDTVAPTGSVTAPLANAFLRGNAVTVASNSADTGSSGVASAQFQVAPHLGTFANLGTAVTGSPFQTTWNTTSGYPDGQYDLKVTTADKAGNTTTSVIVVVRVDNTAPTGAITAPVANAAIRGISVAVTSNSADTGGSGVTSVQFQVAPHGGSFSALGAADTVTPYSVTWNTSGGGYADGQWDVQVVTTDAAGNTFTSPVTLVTVDNTAPTNGLTLSGQSGGGSYLSGTNVYYRGAVAGSFTITNSVPDAASGPASSAFPVLTNTPTGWTHVTSTVSTPAGGPYVSNAFSWLAGSSSGPKELITGTDRAGNTVATTLTFVNDSAAPSLGAVTVNGTGASGGGSTSTTSSTSFTITNRTDYAAGGGASLASSTLTVQSEILSGGSCGAPGSGGPYPSATVIAGTANPSITAGFCYLYTLTGTDNVGNQASVRTTVTVTAPAPTGLVFTGCPTGTITCNAGTGSVSLAKPSQGGGSWTDRVSLVDANGNVVVNTGTSAITVTVGHFVNGTSITFSSGTALTIPVGSSQSANTFTYSNAGAQTESGTDLVYAQSGALDPGYAWVTW